MVSLLSAMTLPFQVARAMMYLVTLQLRRPARTGLRPTDTTLSDLAPQREIESSGRNQKRDYFAAPIDSMCMLLAEASSVAFTVTLSP